MAFKRARGANVVVALAVETAYGVPPGSGFFKMPIAGQIDIGDEQGLIPSDLIGFGREPLASSDDVVNNSGNVVVPVDARYFGIWLKMMFGAPTSTQGVAASGALVFSAQPANNATITINGTAFTFKNSPTLATDLKIGTDLADTLAQAIPVLNASADANVKVATYSADADLTKITVTHDTIGTAGNTFTLAAGSSPASNATPSGATLAGGSASGPYNHVFTSGAANLPSASIEKGMTDVLQFFMNYGVCAGSMTIPMQRSGLLNSTISLVAQGELAPTGSTGAGTPTEYVIERFSQSVGAIKRDGVPLGRIQSASPKFDNGLEPDDSIRPDGRIGGVDAGEIVATVENLVVRFGDPTLYNLAVNKTPLEMSFVWTTPSGWKLTIVYHRVKLPKSKIPVNGPKGLQATYNAQAERDPVLQRTMTATLVNDVSGY